MKRVKYAILLLLLIPVAIFVSHWYLHRVSGQMEDILSHAQVHAEQKNTAQAENDVNEFLTKWKSSRCVIGTFIKHSELDTVNLSSARLLPYLQSDDQSDFQAECESLRVQMKHIWESEQFSVDNIF